MTTTIPPRSIVVLAWYQASELTTLPITTDICWYCQETVNLQHQDTYTVSRVDGDSKNGYEPCHKACSAACIAENNAENLGIEVHHGVCDHCLEASDHVRVVQASCLTGCDGIHVACYLCQP